MLDEILSRTRAGKLPPWVQVSGTNENDVLDVAYALAQSKPDAAAIMHLAGGQAGNGVYAVEAQPHIAFDLLAEWLQAKAFSLVVLEPFDAVLPAVSWTAAHRAWWIGNNIRRLRPLVRSAKATIVAVCHSPRSGGSTFQAEIGLSLSVCPNCHDTLIFCSGPAVKVGVGPVVWRSDNGRITK